MKLTIESLEMGGKASDLRKNSKNHLGGICGEIETYFTAIAFEDFGGITPNSGVE